MKLLNLILISSISTLLMAKDANITAVKKEAIGYMKMLGKELKSNLKKQLKADKSGVKAVEFCAQKAEEIEKEVNAKLPKYAKVRRTSLKIRDSKNSPDDIDVKVLKEYEKAIADKKFNPKDIKVIVDGNTTRVYKPLIVQKACLKCHGENISKEIKDVIAKKFPNDKAVGFKEGMLRGAIVVELRK